MKIGKALVYAMVVLAFSASVGYALNRDWRHAIYWILVAAINAAAAQL